MTSQKSRKAASSALRTALQKAALLRIMEKEKNKSPSCAMRISMKIDKVVWSMLSDGKSFAEAEIINMVSIKMHIATANPIKLNVFCGRCTILTVIIKT